MNPFYEIKETENSLSDANGKKIESLFIPDDKMLDGLVTETFRSDAGDSLSIISNIPRDVYEDDEIWEISEVLPETTRLTVEKVMTELAGESWFDYTSDEGYNAGEIIDMLSERAFVQISELERANVKACLDNGGKVIAYFPEFVWNEHFEQPEYVPDDISGMKAIEIEKLCDDGSLIINDSSSADGRGKRLDRISFDWLSGDGWMLEVYK